MKLTSLEKSSVFVSLLVMFLSHINAQNNACLQNLNHPGYNTIMQLTPDETIIREYIIHIPVDYKPDVPTALVINMHGFGDCAADFADGIGEFYELNKLADEKTFIVVYPQGAYRPDKEDTYWEPGDNGSTNIFENDVFFIEQLIEEIRTEYNIAESKIYACGYSNGGMMAYSLACNNDGLFAAIGIMSGTMLEEDCSAQIATPIVKFHGIADGVLPYEGSIWYQSVSEVVEFWLNENSIPSNSLVSIELKDGQVLKETYEGGSQNSCLTLYTVYEEFDKPGDHVWFSEEIDGLSPNRILWNFFSDSCNSISSVSEQTNLVDILDIHPNPFSSMIHIDFEKYSDGSWTISNTRGAIIMTGKVKPNQKSIQLGDLPPGLYIFKLNNQVAKILKVE